MSSNARPPWTPEMIVWAANFASDENIASLDASAPGRAYVALSELNAAYRVILACIAYYEGDSLPSVEARCLDLAYRAVVGSRILDACSQGALSLFNVVLAERKVYL